MSGPNFKSARQALADAAAKANPHIVAGSGPRNLQEADPFTKRKVTNSIDEWLMLLKDEHGENLIGMSGMQEGFDKALALRVLHHGIKLWAVVPNKGFGNYYWGRNSRTGENKMAEFNSILEQAWRVTYVMEDIHGLNNTLYMGGVHSNFLRNTYMVEQATSFLVWNSPTPGTQDALASIRATGKPYVLLGLR